METYFKQTQQCLTFMIRKMLQKFIKFAQQDLYLSYFSVCFNTVISFMFHTALMQPKVLKEQQ